MTPNSLKIQCTIAAAFLLLGLSGSVLADGFQGSWVLNDTQGSPFDVMLDKDGTASGTHLTSMKHGTWEEKDGAAIIHWDTGWTTRITKDGEKYFKTAFKPGVSLTDKPTNTSEARKKN
jgi:hypothetical protein